jgi:hypothetical protein
MDDQSNESDDESNESENESNHDIRGHVKIKFEILCGCLQTRGLFTECGNTKVYISN